MQLDYRFGPDLGELTEEEATKIGEIVEHPHWPIFIKYLHIERWATINNGIILAKKEAEYGYCQGDIGRINKLESDMRAYHAQFQSSGQVKSMKKEHHQVTSDHFADYSDDDDLPLSP